MTAGALNRVTCLLCILLPHVHSSMASFSLLAMHSATSVHTNTRSLCMHIAWVTHTTHVTPPNLSIHYGNDISCLSPSVGGRDLTRQREECGIIGGNAAGANILCRMSGRAYIPIFAAIENRAHNASFRLPKPAPSALPAFNTSPETCLPIDRLVM